MNDSLEKVIGIIVKDVGPDKIMLFGSRAKGDSKEESNYDIYVIKQGV